MIQEIELQVTDRTTPEEYQQIFSGLVAYNESHAPGANARELAVLARRGSEIVGGVLGLTHWNWLHVRFLYVREECRGQGLGRRLMAAAEAEARQRGCAHVHLDTFGFQAQGFYERLGYTVFGVLEDYPPGHRRIFLQRRDLPAG